jgi:hypothetical protein
MWRLSCLQSYLLVDADYRPWVDLPGQLLELYETTIRYKNLPNVDMTLIFGDEITEKPFLHVLPVLSFFKGDRHKSGIRMPPSAQYR